MERNNQRGAKKLHEGKPMDAMKNDACRNAAMTRCDEGHRKQDMELKHENADLRAKQHAQEKKSIRAVCAPRLGSAIVDNKKRKRGINHKDDAEELNAENWCWIAACACRHAGREACRKESRKRDCSIAARIINDA